jgi:hypothetical protein
MAAAGSRAPHAALPLSCAYAIPRHSISVAPLPRAFHGRCHNVDVLWQAVGEKRADH